ncbi:hypothetical protein PVAP13_9NG185573 [Panicum virgatum]|uniref:Uncharacterized protein n=1 Tax=Panicum virgatum TaxID=38727 RepID=A0A8T0MGD6_PANVG|nr:hypothetical protein PVAP13_9NG185573 [Panicum virgatum]
MAPRRSSAARGARWGARQLGLHTRRRSSRERDGRGAGLGGGASSAGATACAFAGARRWPPRRAPVRRRPPAATALALRGSGRGGAPGPRPGALEADGARSPAASALAGLVAGGSRAPPHTMAGAAARTVAGRRGKGRGGVPRRAQRSGTAARMVAGRRGEPGARARRRGWVRGAMASAVAGRGGECEGGAQRRRGRRRSTAASWWRGAGRAAPAQGEREGWSHRRKERGWVGEREEGVEREEGEMHER